MKSKLYIETSIISYLTARPSRDTFVLANQMLAKEWWNEYRNRFQTFVSELVINEIARGDEGMARLRLHAVRDIPLIDMTDEAYDLAREILRRKILPEKAAVDVSHISISSVHEMEYLLTLNCRHIANVFIYRRVREVCKDFGYEPPEICTLQEILKKENKLDD